MAAPARELPRLLEHWRMMRGRLLRFFYRYTACWQESGDLTQEVAFRLLRLKRPLLNESAARAYVWTAARSVSADWREQRRRSVLTVPIDDLTCSTVPDENVSAHDQLVCEQLVDAYLSVLTFAQRGVLQLQRHGFTCEEIAAELSISVHTVRGYLKSARRTLCDLFRQGDAHGHL